MGKIILGLLVVLVLTFIAFVWPTAYKYDKVDFGGIKTVVRINRFTGNSEMLLPNGWKRMGAKPGQLEKEGDYLDRMSQEPARSNTQPDIFDRVTNNCPWH